MPEPITPEATAFEDALDSGIDLQRLPASAQYAISFFLVVFTTLLAFALFTAISPSNVALLYVLPVVVTAGCCGYGASLAAVALSVLAFDFFFTEPYYSLAMTNPAEIWAATLLLVIATMVAIVASNARRRALDATASAERIAALQALAHAVVHTTTAREVTQATATTLRRLFHGPVVIFARDGDLLEVVALLGEASLRDEDRQAALAALGSRINTRGGSIPHDRAYFDFWPVPAQGGRDYVLGVDFAHAANGRPSGYVDLMEGVLGYMAVAASRADWRVGA